MTKFQLYWRSTLVLLTYLTVVLCMSNITAVYLTGNHLPVQENLIIGAISTFIWGMGSLLLYFLTLESVNNNPRAKLLVALEIIMLWLFLWPLGIIASLAFNDCSLDVQGVIGQVKKSFWQMLQVTIAYIFTRFNVIKAFIKALY